MFGVESLVKPSNATSLYADFSGEFPAAPNRGAATFVVNLRGIHIPYLHVEATGVNRISLGTPNDRTRLPSLRADLSIAQRQVESSRSIAMMLANFRDLEDNPMSVGRPISKISRFGASKHHYEAYDALRLAGDAETGVCILSALPTGGAEWWMLSASDTVVAEGDSNDGYRLGKVCLQVLGNTSAKPEIVTSQERVV
jgi:hypothetical protein